MNSQFEAYKKPPIDDSAPNKKKNDKKKKNKNQEKEIQFIEQPKQMENQWFNNEKTENSKKIEKNNSNFKKLNETKNKNIPEEIKFEEEDFPTKQMPSFNKNTKKEQNIQTGSSQIGNLNEDDQTFLRNKMQKKNSNLEGNEINKELSNLNVILKKNKSEKLGILTTILSSFQSKKSNFKTQTSQILELLTDFAEESEEKAVELINSFFLELFFCETLKEIISQGSQIVKDHEYTEIIKMISNLQLLYQFMIKHSFTDQKPLENFPINTIMEALDLFMGSRTKAKEIEKIEKLRKSFTEYKNISSERKKEELRKKIAEQEKEEEKARKEKYIKSKPRKVDITYKDQSLIDVKDIFFDREDFFPHVIGSKYDSWEQYLNNMFYLLKEVFYFFI